MVSAGSIFGINDVGNGAKINGNTISSYGIIVKIASDWGIGTRTYIGMKGYVHKESK